MKSERLLERLKVRDFKLNALLDVTRAINNNLSTDNLLLQFREIVEERLGISRLVLFGKREQQWECMLQCGVDGGYESIDVEEVFMPYREMEIVQSFEHHPFKDFSILIPVFHNDQPLAYLLVGDINEEEIRMSPTITHMGFIQTLTNIFTVAIENKTLEKQNIERERMNRELELAAEMQSLLVNSGHKVYDAFEMASYYKPHQAVGGDFYDFIPLNENEVVFCVADVSGKGVSAAFLMANFQAYLKAILAYTEWTLETIAHEMNKKVMDTVNGDRFVTFFIAHYNKTNRTLKYINAGHNPPVLYSGRQTSILEKGTVGIGMLKELPFVNVGTEILEKDSIIMCYTDGVVEIENDHEEEFGYERLANIMTTKLSTPVELIEKVISELEVFKGGRPYFDDTALLCCKFF